MKILGIKRSTGEFTDTKSGNKVTFDNYNLYVTDDNPGINAHGVTLYLPKGKLPSVRTSLMDEVLQRYKLTNVASIINHECQLYYDPYGKVCDLTLK